MREVGVLEAKTNLSALLDEIEKGGEPVVITRHGKPIARLTHILPAERKLSGKALLARMKALQATQKNDEPISWEDLKEEIRQ